MEIHIGSVLNAAWNVVGVQLFGPATNQAAGAEPGWITWPTVILPVLKGCLDVFTKAREPVQRHADLPGSSAAEEPFMSGGYVGRSEKSVTDRSMIDVEQFRGSASTGRPDGPERSAECGLRASVPWGRSASDLPRVRRGLGARGCPLQAEVSKPHLLLVRAVGSAREGANARLRVSAIGRCTARQNGVRSTRRGQWLNECVSDVRHSVQRLAREAGLPCGTTKSNFFSLTLVIVCPSPGPWGRRLLSPPGALACDTS
jgi:hypothetical protein